MLPLQVSPIFYSHANIEIDREELIKLEGFTVPKSPAWEKETFIPRECKIFPIESSTLGISLGVIALGISPTRSLNDSYNSYLKLVAAQTAAVIGNARYVPDAHLW